MSHSRVVRFAVVGVKGYSRTHLRLVEMLSDQGRGRLVASVMIDKADHPELVASFQEQGVQIYEDYATMLDACRGQVDIVTLPVPIYLHASMAIQALRRGYHVFVEKPVAGSLDEVDQLIAAREKSGRQCAVGFQQIYSPVFRTLQEYVLGGKLGKVDRISIMALWPRGLPYYARNEWAGRLFCGGRPVYDSPFNNALAHQVMNMLYLASPEPGQAAYCTDMEAELYRAYDIESFDTGCMRARTDSGIEIVFAATHACRENVDPIMRLEAEGARVDWQIGGSAAIAYADGTVETLSEPDRPHQYMMSNIADAVTGVVPTPICTVEVGRAHVACIETLHRTASIRTVPNRLVSHADEGQRIIAGIDRAVRQTFETGRLFSEQQLPFTELPL